MFKASLKNNNIPELGTVTVEFPIPEAQYEETIRALNGIQSGAVVEQDCFVADIGTADCPALERLIGTMANVDELDWLGKQLESFDRYELLQFNAAVERFGLSAADELIDLSFCAREVTVVSDFNDLELVGKRHYLTVHGACDSEELENLDGTETALALISGQPGYVTQFGVVYDNGVKLERVYDRKYFPPGWRAENCVMELKLSTRGEKDAKKCEWMQLPASQIKLERAMLRAGIASCCEMQMLVSDSRFPDEVDCALNFEHESLFELNRLCRACSNFKEQDFVKLGAVCQMAKPACAANIRQLAENLDQFDFAPNVHTPEELGKYMIQQSGHYEYDENLEDFYNYGDYGVNRMLQEDGVFTDHGYVSYHGTLTLEELMRDDAAESYQQEQETNMEGMSWYLDVFLEWYEDSQRKTEHFMTGKTLSESGADLDRMFLISSAITKAFRGDNSVHTRYMVVGAQPEPEETMALHLSPDEQRLVAQALAEQRIRLGPQAEGEEKLLRRMTGSVTEYMDAAGMSNRLDENDRALLAQHDGEPEATPVMGGMQL